MSRRNFLKAAVVGGAVSAAAISGTVLLTQHTYAAATFIAAVDRYGDSLRTHLQNGFKALGLTSKHISGKRVLLKPNLVEPHMGVGHINTHPLVVRAAIDTFLQLGAAEIVVAEGSGHRRDSLYILEETGLADVLAEDKIPFVDLNRADIFIVKNQGARTRLSHLLLPLEILKADIIVSMAKMKTHHWTGATLSMKNLFGLMPGAYYGWPKNVLHAAGIQECILDINSTVQPQVAIVDGIIGMEGDGPIMGTPIQSGVLVMGRSLPAVDATCARIMGLNPDKIKYLKYAADTIGPIEEKLIEQRGETIERVSKPYALLDKIPAHRGLRLK
jgi:uncharacterized protein (DUF362 family)